MSDDDTLSTREVAARLGVDVSTVRRRRKRGELVAHEIHTIHGPEWRYPAHLLPAPPAAPANAPVSAPPAERGLTAPQAGREAQGMRELVERAAAAEALASYLLMRVRELEAERAPPARTPWWRRLLGRLPR